MSEKTRDSIDHLQISIDSTQSDHFARKQQQDAERDNNTREKIRAAADVIGEDRPTRSENSSHISCADMSHRTAPHRTVESLRKIGRRIFVELSGVGTAHTHTTQLQRFATRETPRHYDLNPLLLRVLKLGHARSSNSRTDSLFLLTAELSLARQRTKPEETCD